MPIPQEAPQEKPNTITVVIPGYGEFALEPRMAVQINAALKWAQNNPLMLGEIAQRAKIAETQVGFEDDETTRVTGHSRLFAQGLITREELASAGIPMSEVMRDIRDFGWKIRPQQPRPQESRPILETPTAPAETLSQRLERKGLSEEYQTLLAAEAKPAPGLPGVPSSGAVPLPVRERGEVTPALPKWAGIIEQMQLASQSILADVPQDTVAATAAPAIPQESLASRMAEAERLALGNQNQLAPVTGDTVPTPDAVTIPAEEEQQAEAPVAPTRELTPYAEIQADLEAGQTARAAEVGYDPTKPPGRFVDGKLVYEEPQVQSKSDKVEVPTPATPQRQAETPSTLGNPALAVAEDAYSFSILNARLPEPEGPQGKITLDDVKRVAKEYGVDPLQLLYESGIPRIPTTGAEIPFGAAFSRGAYSGLRRYAQIFGANPEPGQLPPRLRESGLARFLGEATTATVPFVAGSGIVGMGMKGLGLTSRMTPLAYSMTRSAATGALLGMGKTPAGEDFKFSELAKNMGEEAALWTAFDVGMLALSGRLAGLAQSGREIRGIRRQIRGGEQFVDPVLLDWENALFVNAARDWRAVANRVHRLWSVNPENRFEAIVGETLATTEAWGATVLKDLDNKSLNEVVAQVKKALPETYGTAVHDAGAGRSSLLILDKEAIRGRGFAKRTKEQLYRFQQTGEIDEVLLVDMLQRGMMDRGGLPPLEVQVRRPETGVPEARYEFSFGQTTQALAERRIVISMPKDANPQELISALAHELTHDMIVTSLGRNPQRMAGLIREIFGADYMGSPNLYRGFKVEHLDQPKIVGKHKIGASFDHNTQTIRWNEEGMKAAWDRFRSGKTVVPGVYRPANIKTYEQFKRFAFEHERQHTRLRRFTNESKVEFESRVNRAAEQELARRPLKGGERTWYRELREVQRALHTQKLGSRKAGLEHIRKNGLDKDEFELLSDFIEYVSYSSQRLGRAYAKAPNVTDRILGWAREESLVLQSILDRELIGTEAMLREYATRVGTASDDLMSAAQKIKGRKASVRQMMAEQRVSAEQALAQYEREGAYDGMRVFLEGRLMEVEKRFFNSGRIRLRDLERVNGRYKTIEVDDVRVQFPTIQGNIKYFETAINIVNNLLKYGPPKTLGVFVQDARGGVGRAVFRTQDLVYHRGTRGELIEAIRKEMGDDFIRGIDDEADAIIRWARQKGFKGAMIDEDVQLTIVAEPTQAALHYHDIPPELIDLVHGSINEKEFMLSAEDVIAEGLYQAGIPTREVENMAKFAMNRKSYQLRDLIDEDFAPQALDDIWGDILEAVHFFDDAGQRSMRHGSGRVSTLPDGRYMVVVNDGPIPGGQIAAILNSKEEVKRYVAQMAPSPGAPNLSKGSTIPDAFGVGNNPKGGAAPFRWGETAESAMRSGGIDRANDLDRMRWSDRKDQILRGSERAGEGLKRFATIMTSSRTLFQEYEKRGMGPIFSSIWQKSQDSMNRIKTIMNTPDAAFGVRKGGKAHTPISGTQNFQRRIQKLVPSERRPLLTQLQQAITREELKSLVNYSQDSLDVIRLLEGAAKQGIDMRFKIATLTGNMDAARRYLANPEGFIRMMQAELRGSVPTSQRDLARSMMKFQNAPESITIESILRGMGHTPEEAKIMQGVVERINDGKDIDLFGIARYFTAGQSRQQFIAANKMTAQEVALSDELRKYIEEAMKVPGDLTESQVKQSADVFLKTVLPEMKNFVEQGFNINHRTITKYFGNHNEFLHRRMVSGDLNVYVNDPGYLAWRTYRGKLMQTHWEPLRQGEIRDAQQHMARILEGQNNVPYKNVERYLEELEGIPHESFAQVEDALIGVFEKVGLTKYVEPTILRDMFQKMNMVTYKATIPFRPLLLVRNASEVYRLGGIVGGRSLGHGINYVMSPKTRVQAMLEAKLAGALKPDLPVFTVDPSARTAIRGRVLRDVPGGNKIESGTQLMQRGVQLLDDAAEKGMSFYQRVDEYTRSIAYHSMQHRIRTNMHLAKPGSWNKFLERAKLSTFDKTEIAEFENLWASGRQDDAIKYAAVTFSDKSLFLYGNANHPVGWGSTYGVLFGQFGTWPVQYKDFLINGMSRGTGKDRLEFAAWNLIGPAIVVAEGKKIGIDLSSWWGTTSLAYTGGPYMDLGIDVVRALGGNDLERSMALSNLRRSLPTTTPIPNVVVPLSFATNDFYEILTGQRPPIEFLVKTTRE